MDYDLIIAIVAAMVNIVFSLLLPPLFSSTNLPFKDQVTENYENTKHIILVSSILTVVLVYLSLKVTPWVNNHIFKNLARLNLSPTSTINTTI